MGFFLISVVARSPPSPSATRSSNVEVSWFLAVQRVKEGKFALFVDMRPRASQAVSEYSH